VKPLVATTMLAAASLAPPGARAQTGPEPPAAATPAPTAPPADGVSIEEIDRVVVRWYARATGGVVTPRFIGARELGFEARLEALAEGRVPGARLEDKHVRAAIQRHITEAILASLPVDPEPTPRQVGSYAEDARLVLEQRVGGRARLNAAASAEGLNADELNSLLRRRARASWYLDKMVAPMLEPTEIDLREVHSRGETPFSSEPFGEVVDLVRNWYVSTRLSAALDRYYRSISTKVTVRLVVR
jgi:hypothetical protein